MSFYCFFQEILGYCFLLSCLKYVSTLSSAVWMASLCRKMLILECFLLLLITINLLIPNCGQLDKFGVVFDCKHFDFEWLADRNTFAVPYLQETLERQWDYCCAFRRKARQPSFINEYFQASTCLRDDLLDMSSYSDHKLKERILRISVAL